MVYPREKRLIHRNIIGLMWIWNLYTWFLNVSTWGRQFRRAIIGDAVHNRALDCWPHSEGARRACKNMHEHKSIMIPQKLQFLLYTRIHYDTSSTTRNVKILSNRLCLWTNAFPIKLLLILVTYRCLLSQTMSIASAIKSNSSFTSDSNSSWSQTWGHSSVHFFCSQTHKHSIA